MKEKAIIIEIKECGNVNQTTVIGYQDFGNIRNQKFFILIKQSLSNNGRKNRIDWR